MKQLMRGLLVAGAVMVGAGTGAVQAEPLRIAIGGAFTSMDPHFYNATPNHLSRCISSTVLSIAHRMSA